MKKLVAALCVTVVLILNLIPAQAEQWESNPLKTDQERFREQISPINISPREAQIGHEKALQNESTSKQTAQEKFRDEISGGLPSIKDLTTAEKHSREQKILRESLRMPNFSIKDSINSTQKMKQNEKEKQTGQEYLINSIRGNNPSIRDTMVAERNMKQKEKEKGVFGYGAVADYVIVSLMIVGVIATLRFLMSAVSSFSKSTDLAGMIQKYKGDYTNPQIVLELYQYCYNHKLLSPIVRRYNASVGDFSLIYLYLLSHCPAVGKGHFIPISTFFFAASLDYVLAREDFLNFEDTLWLKRYFGLIAG